MDCVGQYHQAIGRGEHHKGIGQAGNKSMLGYRAGFGVPGYTGFIPSTESLLLPTKEGLAVRQPIDTTVPSPRFTVLRVHGRVRMRACACANESCLLSVCTRMRERELPLRACACARANKNRLLPTSSTPVVRYLRRRNGLLDRA